MRKPKLLDLFCGVGGASMGYYRAGFEVEGVDIKPQPHYPFKFYQADALEFPLEGYAAYHASPPCQYYSMMQNIHKNKNKHPDLIPPVREILLKIQKPFVIENVYGSPLKGHLMLCGTMFGLKIRKHRYFETNFPMPLFAPRVCNHKQVYDHYHGGEEQRGEKEKLAEILDIDWMVGNYRSEIRQAIPPAYTEYIGKYLMEFLVARKKDKE